MADIHSTGVRDDTFPAPSKTAEGTVGGIPTTATSTSFSDKILITLSQDGRLAQWVPPHPASAFKSIP